MNFIEEIKNKYDYSKLSQLEIARVLYLELGKVLSFSTNYNNDGKLKTEFDKSEVIKTKEVTCAIWAEIYSDLLSYFKIENKIVKLGHNFVEFYIDGKKWVADATHGRYTDLSRIHNNDETFLFGLSIYQKNDDKHSNIPCYDEKINQMLNDIDTKFNYINEDFEKLKELKKELASIKNGEKSVEFDNEHIVESKMDYLFSKLGTLKNGYYESKDFVKEMEWYLLNDEDKEKIHGRELKKYQNNHVDIIQIISLFENNKYTYYLIRENSPVIKVNKELIMKLPSLGFGKEKEIPGISYPKKYIPGKKDNFILTKLKSRKFNLDDLYQNELTR